MAARPSLLDRRDPSEITLTIYHQCQRAACGSLQGLASRHPEDILAEIEALGLDLSGD